MLNIQIMLSDLPESLKRIYHHEHPIDIKVNPDGSRPITSHKADSVDNINTRVPTDTDGKTWRIWVNKETGETQIEQWGKGSLEETIKALQENYDIELKMPYSGEKSRKSESLDISEKLREYNAGTSSDTDDTDKELKDILKELK